MEKSSLIYWATVQNICLIPRCLKCLVHVENATAGDQGVSRYGQIIGTLSVDTKDTGMGGQEN